MRRIVGARFRGSGKLYYFTPGRHYVREGNEVIVETARGLEFADVVSNPREVDEKAVSGQIRRIVRLATDADRKRLADNAAAAEEAFNVALEKIAKNKIDMKLVSVEYTFDGNKIIFSFTADGRVDFRELVKDLASAFKARIELRQIGVRDEARMLGGLGSCGRPICCASFLGDFHPVSIKMAKEQSLSLNPTKISGLCGRLMCCLQYEQNYYEGMRKKMPKLNKPVTTKDGSGVVVENNAITCISKVKVTLQDGTIEIRDYPIDELRWNRQPRDTKAEPVEKEMTEPLPEELKALEDH